MDITGDSQYQCWNLTEKDAEKVRELLSHAQKYEAIARCDSGGADGLVVWRVFDVGREIHGRCVYYAVVCVSFWSR